MKKITYSILTFLFVIFHNSDLSAQQLRVVDGYLIINNSSLVLQDMNLVNDGTLTSTNATVSFTGTNVNTISGDNIPTFDSLVINKHSDGIQLEQNISINSHLDLTAGLLDLQDTDANLAAGTSIDNANSSTYVKTSGTGKLVQQVSNSEINFPIGNSSYNPVILNNDEGVSDFYAVRVKDELLENGISGDAVTNYGVNRTWEISEQTAGGSNLAITLTWEDTDEVGTTGSNYVQANYNGGWTKVAEGAAGTTLGLNSISSTNNANLGDFAVFEDRSPLTDSYVCNENGSLAVTGNMSELSNYHAQTDLTSDAVIESGANILYTANDEILLNEGFTVEYGAEFHAFIATCTFSDNLKVVSPKLTLPVVEPRAKMELTVFPNPFTTQTNIEFFLPVVSSVQLFISNLQGRVIHTQTFDNGLVGWQSTTFSAGNLPAGMYVLSLRSGKELVQKQLIIAK